MRLGTGRRPPGGGGRGGRRRDSIRTSRQGTLRDLEARQRGALGIDEDHREKQPGLLVGGRDQSACGKDGAEWGWDMSACNKLDYEK